MSANQTPFIKQAMLMLVSPKCYETFFYKLNFFDGACLKALISKCLGLALVAGSMMVKVPQITKLWGNQSATGVSFLSCLTDLYAVTIYTCYSFVKAFPFSAYGDGLFVGIQTFIIAALVLYFNSSSSSASLFSLAYLVIVYILAGGLTPIDILWYMQAVSVPIMFFGKVSPSYRYDSSLAVELGLASAFDAKASSSGRTEDDAFASKALANPNSTASDDGLTSIQLAQAYTNYKNGGTGQLSAATCTMLLFGSTARVFTSIQETGDAIVILTYVLATIGNAVIVAQFIQYRDTTPKQTIKEKKIK